MPDASHVSARPAIRCSPRPRAIPRSHCSLGPPGGWAIFAPSIEKPVANISGSSASDAPSSAARLSSFAAPAWLDFQSSQARSIWSRATRIGTDYGRVARSTRWTNER